VSLDPTKQKQLMGDQPSDSSSSTSVSSVGHGGSLTYVRGGSSAFGRGSSSTLDRDRGGSSTLDRGSSLGRGGKASRQMPATTRSASRGVESSGIYHLSQSNAVVSVFHRQLLCSVGFSVNSADAVRVIFLFHF